MTSRTLIRGLDDRRLPGSPRTVLLEDGRIAALDEAAAGEPAADARTIDADGLSAAPGYIELQLNGIAGRDFTSDPASIWEVSDSLAGRGITAFLPTIITSPRGSVDAAIEAFVAGPQTDGPEPLGLHLEGPFISPQRSGAHSPEHLRPVDVGEVGTWLRSGAVRMVTLAPELPGAIEAIAVIATAGAVAAVGHTDADADVTARAVAAGARYATHLFNAMPPLRHRAPGAAGALLADERVTLGLIVDGQHLDPIVVDLVGRIAADRVSLVSDAIAALDMPAGVHRLGGQSVIVADGVARLDGGTLAGSVSGLDDCVRGFAAATGSASAAIAAVTSSPARLLGLQDRGRLSVGARADLVLLDAGLNVRVTVVGGRPVYDPDGRWH